MLWSGVPQRRHIAIDGKDSYLDHLEKMMLAMAMAKQNNISIRTFELSGFRSAVPEHHPKLLSLMNDALANGRDLVLRDSSNAWDFMLSIHLPQIIRLEE